MRALRLVLQAQLRSTEREGGHVILEHMWLNGPLSNYITRLV
jgi:hypothetical protein